MQGTLTLNSSCLSTLSYKQKERGRVPICRLTSQMSLTAGLGQAEARSSIQDPSLVGSTQLLEPPPAAPWDAQQQKGGIRSGAGN